MRNAKRSKAVLKRWKTSEPMSVYAFYIAGVLHVTAWDFAPYAFLNWMVPVFSILCAMTGFGIWKNGTPARG